MKRREENKAPVHLARLSAVADKSKMLQLSANLNMLLDLRAIEGCLDQLETFSYPPVDASPTILVSHTALRSQLNEALATSQQEVYEALSVLSKVEERVAAIRQRLQHRYAALANLAAPVSGLPVEILRDIFLMYAAETPTSRSSILLSHVSARWRAVSINLPELWTVIQLRPDQSSGMLDTFLHRSAKLRVHISPSFRNVNLFDIRLDPKSAPRLLSMSNIDNLTEQSTASWGRCAQYLDLENLRFGPGERFPPAYHHKSEDLHARCLQLEGHTWNLALDAGGPHSQVPMERLAHLEIADMSPGVLYATMRGVDMPNLEVLELRGIQFAHGASNTGAGLPPLFPRVRRFVLSSCDEPSAHRILYDCTMPTLSTACLDLSLCQTLSNLHAFLRRSPTLRQLALTIPAPSLTALYRTLSSKAPALRDLTILLAAHSAPRSVKTFPDNSATLRKVLQSRLESPDLAPIESLTLSEHLVGAEVDWFIQNTALTRVPSDDVWSIEEGSEEVDSSEYESGEADDADV